MRRNRAFVPGPGARSTPPFLIGKRCPKIYQMRRLFLVAILLATLAGCGGSAVKKDVKRLKNKCDVVAGSSVSEEGARCIAKIYGIQNKKSCPMEVDRPDSFAQAVFRVRESCNGLGVVIAESNGRVVAIVAYDEILY